MASTEIPNTGSFKFDVNGFDFSKNAQENILVSDIDILDLITITKVCDRDDKKYITGDIVTYTVTIELGEVGVLQNQYFEDIIPDELEFIEGSLKGDGNQLSGDPSNIPLSWEQNSTHTIEYQCTIL